MPAPNTNACFTRGIYADAMTAQMELAATDQAARFFRSQVTSSTITTTEAMAGSV
jgi:hypothetical protein